MKNIAMAFLVLFSSSVFSQIKTGGGIIDMDTHSIFPFEDGSGTTTAEHRFLEYIRMRHLSCSTLNFRAMVMEHNFIKIYTQLSIIKTSYEANGTCGLINPYLRCLADSTYFELLQNLKVDPQFQKRMSVQLKINENETDQMLNFFGNLDQQCQDKCE